VAGHSRADLDKLFGDWRWNGIVVRGETFEVKRDGFLNVNGRFRSGLTLRDATGERWNFRDKHSILILLNQHTILHEFSSEYIFGILFVNGKRRIKI
jgi:hypothetical protein